MIASILYSHNPLWVFFSAFDILSPLSGRLAQLARALALQAGGRWFESSTAHQPVSVHGRGDCETRIPAERLSAGISRRRRAEEGWSNSLRPFVCSLS